MRAVSLCLLLTHAPPLPNAPPHLSVQTCQSDPEGKRSAQKEVRAILQAFFSRMQMAAQVRA